MEEIRINSLKEINSGSNLPLKSPKSQQFEEALLLLDVTKSPPLSVQSSPIGDTSSDLISYGNDQSVSTNDNSTDKPRTDVDLLFAASLLVQNKHKKVEKKRRKTPHVARATNANGQQRQCNFCLATVTPMWRHGPAGYEDLCNKCGVKWMRGKILTNVAQHPSFASKS